MAYDLDGDRVKCSFVPNSTVPGNISMDEVKLAVHEPNLLHTAIGKKKMKKKKRKRKKKKYKGFSKGDIFVIFLGKKIPLNRRLCVQVWPRM